MRPKRRAKVSSRHKQASRPKYERPKDIVYLVGAGATQSEVAHRGAAAVNMLMRNAAGVEGISGAILSKAPDAKTLGLGDSGDIEKLISLLSGAGINFLSETAERMRRLYFSEIVSRLTEAKVIGRPLLALALLEMHSDKLFARSVESVSAILTTNHDGLFQIASQEVFGALDLCIPYVSGEFSEPKLGSDRAPPPILNLHGSFTWEFGVPMKVTSLTSGSRYSVDTTWIPPTVAKDSKSFPFNKIAGHALDFLLRRCDVLRVVGASLTQNDWNVLAMIFTAQVQRQVADKSPFRIELIMPHKRGEEIRSECGFLSNVVPFGLLSEGRYDMFSELKPRLTDEQQNPFLYWLREKIRYHRRLGHLEQRSTGQFVKELMEEET